MRAYLPVRSCGGGPAVVLAAAILSLLPSSSLFAVHAYPNGVGSCERGFDKFPGGSEHNYQSDLNANWGDLASYGLTLTLDSIPLPRPTGGSAYHYTGSCGPNRGGFLCGKCQGSCTRDRHCEDGLVCMVRDGVENDEDEPVPGCEMSGGYWNGTNYCYDPDDARRELLLQNGGMKDGGGERKRKLQGQVSDVTSLTLTAGSSYRLLLESPSGGYFKGYLLRLEGPSGQNMSEAIKAVAGSESSMQILPSSVEGPTMGVYSYGDDEDEVAIPPICELNVAAACHDEAGEKTSVMAEIEIPENAVGRMNLEVTVVVEWDRWYLTSYDLTVEAAQPQQAGSAESTEPTEPTEPAKPAEEPDQDPQDDGEGNTEDADVDEGEGGQDQDRDEGAPQEAGEDADAAPASEGDADADADADGATSPASGGDGDQQQQDDPSFENPADDPSRPVSNADIESASTEEDPEESWDPDEDCAYPPSVTCNKVGGPPTLDGDLSEWDEAGAEMVMSPLTTAMGVRLYPGGEMRIRCVFDDTHLHLGVEVPGSYSPPSDSTANGGDDQDDGDRDGDMSAEEIEFKRTRSYPAIASMLKVGSEATLYHMGGCVAACPASPDGAGSIVPEECADRAVDVGGHLEVGASGKTEMGVPHDLGSGKGRVSSYCKLLETDGDEAGSESETEWTAAWSHRAAAAPAADVLVERSAEQPTPTGVYTFEMSRRLLTPSDPASSAQLMEGNTYSFGVAFWDPNEGVGGEENMDKVVGWTNGWTKAGKYVTGCSRDWMDLVIGEQPDDGSGNVGEVGGNATASGAGDDGAGDVGAAARSTATIRSSFPGAVATALIAAAAAASWVVM